MMHPIYLQWGILILFGMAFFFIAPRAKSLAEFFNARDGKDKKPGIILLTSSLVISWIFAKSITNAANLGLLFGLVGGVAYAVYYLSFIVAGIVIYKLRVNGGFHSIHHFLESKFGRSAVVFFSILIGFRLFNEVWSNTMVIGSYFGEVNTNGYYTAIVVFTLLTLAYTLKGGMRSSMLTDAIQMAFFGVMLFLLLGFIFSDPAGDVVQLVNTGLWEMSAGVNLIFAALLQVFSYPFHDPVLTDRGFVSDPKTTIKSFFWASIIGFICIASFSLVGVYAQIKGLQGQAAVEVGKLLGVAAMLIVNFIMITSAASTLDSTFSSFSKLLVMDLGKKRTLKRGRLAMALITIVGTLPVFLNPEILSATTISGTMVMGLAPVFVFWNKKTGPLAFHLPVGFGIVVGTILALGYFPENLIFTTGKYAALLWSNFWGLIVCFALYFLAIYLDHGKKKDH